MKSILFYNWDSLMQEDMLNSLARNGYNVVMINKKMTNYYADDEFFDYTSVLIKRVRPDYCFSFNFFPLLADICKNEDICYVSWVFDSPLLTLYGKSVFNNTNRIFHFDRGTVDSLREYGVNIFHLPLATNPNKYEQLAVRQSYTNMNSVSFVGRIYDKKNLYDQINYLPDYLKGYFSGVMEAQKKVWGYNFMKECLTPDIVDELCKYVKLELLEYFFYTPEIVFSNLFLCQKLASIEREEALALLAQDGEITLYSDSFPDSLKQFSNLKYKGIIDSDSEAPLVFHNSQINLNITLRTILTGIPLRVFEVIGAGGMMISNYQEEISECFEPEREIVMFGSMEELRDKTEFYRRNPEECQKIARAGQKRVREEHTIDHRIKYLFED